MGKERHPHMNTYQMKLHMPPILLCGMFMGWPMQGEGGW